MLPKQQSLQQTPAERWEYRAFCPEAPKIPSKPSAGQGAFVYTLAYCENSARLLIKRKVNKMLERMPNSYVEMRNFQRTRPAPPREKSVRKRNLRRIK